MANGDDNIDSEDQIPSPTPVTSGQEIAANKELFGGQKPADMPAQQKEANQDLTKDDHADPLLEEAQKHYADDEKRYAEAQKRYEEIDGEVTRIREELKNAQIPQPPQLRPYPQYPGGQQGTSPTTDQQDKRGNLGQIMMQAASLIAIGSAVFGRHRNPYSQIVQQSALGGFFQGLAQGQKDKAAEQLQNWNKAVELTDKLNKEDTQTYHDVLANRRLTFAQQMDLGKNIAWQRQDVRMYQAFAAKDANEIMKILSDKAKAHASWVKSQLDLNTRAVNKFLGSERGLAWSQAVEKKFGIKPYKNHDELLKAFEAYPISQWQADRKASGTSVDTEDTEDKTPAATGGDGAGGDSKASPMRLQGTTEDDVNREVNQLPSGTYFTVPGDTTVYRKK